MQTKGSVAVEEEAALSAVPPERRPDRGGPANDDFHRALYEHQPLLMARALRLTHDKDEAQDLVQDTLLRGMRGLHRFQPGTNMRAWLVRIMVNLFLDRCRQHASRPALVPLDDESSSAATPEVEDDPVPLSAQVTFDQLRAALGQLDPLFRSVYELRITQQKSYEEISQELRIPLGTVGTRLLRARARLCRLLTPAGRGKQ
jgi:RNA polymerase sigma-70 factor (ECF subfamily)